MFDFRQANNSSDVPVPEIEPIEDLRKRLAHGWIRFKRIEGWKRWGQKHGDKLDLSNLDDPYDSFYNWITTEPESIVRKFAAERGMSWDSPEARKRRKQAQREWSAAVETVLPLIFNLQWVADPTKPGGGSTGHKIVLDELIACPDYQRLAEIEKYVARYLVDCQIQKPDGSWTLRE